MINKLILFSLVFTSLSTACSKSNTEVSLVPYPASVAPGRGHCNLYGANVTVDSAFDEAGRSYALGFAAQLAGCTGKSGKKTISFRYDSNLGREAYRIDISSQGVTIDASSLNGVVYGVQTLKQLLPTAIYTGDTSVKSGWKVKNMTIEDAPRFAYRGMHLDEGRHFFGTEEVKRYLDIMEMHKLNTFHWHLTEDQGWRIEIKKYPRLTEVGSKRAQTVIGHTNEYDGTPYGGYYTQDEIREIVAYAAARGITVIPEIDLPGHMQAALASYPELGCTSGPYKVWERWGISEDVLCAGQERTFEFLFGVMDELCELFPSEYIHIGGDECPKLRWKSCPECQAKIRELGIKGDDTYSAEDYLQSYVTKRVEEYLSTKGRKIIGWDEILQGELSPNATVMSWRGIEGGIKAAGMGHDAIMTPHVHLYFDYAQSLDRSKEPECIGGFVSVDNVYNYEPCTEEMSEEEASHIIGVQANLWTEYIADSGHLEYMLLPRISALSEVQWCARETKDWKRYHKALINTLVPIYEARGYNFARHALSPDFEATPEERTVTHKALGCRAVNLGALPDKRYALDYPVDLFDGKLGKTHFQSGHWVGFVDGDMDVMVTLPGKRVHSVTLSTLVDKPSWIFNITELRVSASRDGKNFKVIAEESYPVDEPDKADGIRNYTLNFKGTRAKFLRIEAETVRHIPSWHEGRNEPAFAFFDEIIIN